MWKGRIRTVVLLSWTLHTITTAFSAFPSRRGFRQTVDFVLGVGKSLVSFPVELQSRDLFGRINDATSSVTRMSFRSVDVDEVIDPEFLEKKMNDNYDNDFDVSAFAVVSHQSCVLEYDQTGLVYPFMSPLESESTWIEYGDDRSVVAPAGPVGQLKEIMANLLKEPRVEVAISFAVLISCMLVAVSTFDNMPLQDEIVTTENFISAVFAVDFFGRWFSSSKDLGRHVFSLQFALDVVVVMFPLVFGLMPAIDKASLPLPAWMTSPSALINLELLRVLRLRRVFQDMETFVKFERALGIRSTLVQEWQLQLARVLFSLFTLLSVSAGMIYTAEHGVNPAIPDYFTALYFGLCTLSTLGFGDIVPITWQGKLVVCGSILAGVAIVPAQAGALVEALLKRQESKGRRPRTSGDRQELNGSYLPAAKGNDEDGRMVLETSYKCRSCGATMHWSSASFCWSCGEKLP